MKGRGTNYDMEIFITMFNVWYIEEKLQLRA